MNSMALAMVVCCNAQAQVAKCTPRKRPVRQVPKEKTAGRPSRFQAIYHHGESTSAPPSTRQKPMLVAGIRQ